MRAFVAGATMWRIMLTASDGAGQNMLTYHNDNTRQGANTNEVLLGPANVNAASFGRLFSQPVDGYVFAQPLYVSGLVIPGQGTHNAVFVLTEHNSVYAFDADSNTGPDGGLLWQTNLGVSAIMPNNDFGNRYGQDFYLGPEIGMTGTPVIDLSTGTIYLCAFTHEGSNYVHRLHALNITNGAEEPYSPVVVAASVPGGGVASSNGVVWFDPEQQLQRAALTLAGGMLFVAFASQADSDPYHGWVLEYNAATLQLAPNGIFNTTPQATVASFGVNAGEGGIWMAGNGLCVDAKTNVYFMTGNGSFSANTNGGDYGDSFVRLSTTNGLAVADYFTPSYQATLAAEDVDLGSGGAMLLPEAAGSAAHPHLIVGCGKEGNIYLLDRDNMGTYNPNDDNQIVQELGGAIGGAWSSGAYFNNQIYYQGQRDVLKAFSVTNATLSTATLSQSSTAFGFPGATPEISANGTRDAIAWVIQSDAYASSGPAILHAYNATNLAQELYNSSQNLARDNPGGAVKMTVPTVINGKVYVGAQYSFSVYGNGVFLPLPAISPNGGLFTNGVTVTLSDAPGSSIYYTLDGSTPSAGSTLYTGPFVLSASANLQVIAIESGAVNSGIASAGFINTSAPGHGIGLQGQYFSGQVMTFTPPPTLVRTDPAIDFDWNGTAPDPSISSSNFTVRWIGSVQPQYTESYAFYAAAAGGVRLWVNGQELINQWSDQPLTQWSGSIALAAQQLYNIEMDYADQLDPAEAELSWSSPSIPTEIIPQGQLYPVTNPPPTVVLTAPAAGATAIAPASLSLAANAGAPFNPIVSVGFYANSTFLGAVTNVPYALTTTGLSAGAYSLTAVAVDGSGLSSTSAPVNVTINGGTGSPYGLAKRVVTPPFFNMPSTYLGTIPTLLSQTGVFSNTPGMVPLGGLIPYAPNVPLWSDNALKVRYVSVPGTGGSVTPDQQIAFAPTGTWSFPAGTVFVKTFELLTNQGDAASIHRLETRLLVRDTNGAVYGVTYKWRADNSDADLLTTNLTEPISITTPTGVIRQNWYYPSPADCLTCHTPVANYVLGVNTRQLNAPMTYPSGVSDNELRTLNRLGLFFPAPDEAAIPNYEKLSSLTNQSASYQDRGRSYLDANCAQCHQPGGTGGTFDARFDTPLANQNIINAPVLANLGYSGAAVIVPGNVLQSVLYDRINTLDPAIKMPPLARNLIDSNAVAVMAGWINSLPLAPPGEYLLNVTASPAVGGVVSGGGAFAAGSAQEVAAVANDGYQFISWTGEAAGTNNPLAVTMTTNINLIANFGATSTNLTLTVITNGLGHVSPNPNGKHLKAGQSYTLTATATAGNVFSNWTGSIVTNKNPLTLKVKSSLALQANFIPNPFPPFVGRYNGLFICANGVVTEQTAGMLRGLTIGQRGAYSGTLLINGGSHALTGTFSLAGQASNFIAHSSVGPLAVVMTLEGNNPPPEITGTVAGTNWLAWLTAERATNTTGSGEYTMLIPADPDGPASVLPPGDGYGLITNHAGTAEIIGALADGTAFSQTAPVAMTGDVPIYANLYGGKGLLLGWINLGANASGDTLAWVHPKLASGLFPDQFTSTNEIMLSPWTHPAVGVLPTNLLVFDTTQTNDFMIAVSPNLKLSEVSGPTPLSGSIRLQTGLLTVTLGGGSHKTNGYGVILLNATNGGGYMLSKTNAQAIQLAP